MKKLIFLLLFPLSLLAQVDIAPIVVNIADNPSLQYNGAAVKQKATVIYFSNLNGPNKDMLITAQIVFYVNNAGAYGATVLSDIAGNVNLSASQSSSLNQIYANRTFTYSVAGNCTDVSGNIVACSTGGAIPELQYWQGFKINQIPGYTSPTMSALQFDYLVIAAFLNALNNRKSW